MTGMALAIDTVESPRRTIETDLTEDGMTVDPIVGGPGGSHVNTGSIRANIVVRLSRSWVKLNYYINPTY